MRLGENKRYLIIDHLKVKTVWGSKYSHDTLVRSQSHLEFWKISPELFLTGSHDLQTQIVKQNQNLP